MIAKSPDFNELDTALQSNKSGINRETRPDLNMLSTLNDKLTAKQSEFARLVAEENITGSDEYRLAHKPKPSVDNKSINPLFTNI